MLSMTSTPGRTTLHLIQQQPWDSTCTWRELDTGPYNTAKSVWGPHDWSVLRPTAVHWDKRTIHGSTLDSSLGAYVGLEGEHVRGGSTPGRQWQPKVNGGHATEHAEPHGQFTGIDDFIARATSTKVRRGCHRGRQHANHTGFGVAVLNCTQEVENGPFWTAPSGLKRAARHVLRLFPLFNSGPTCHSLTI